MIPAESTVSFGIPQSQEPKYGVDAAGRLFNRSTGIPIPDDEPVMLFRAKDSKALRALRAYAAAVTSPDHGAVVRSRILDFEAFAAANPDRMKEPDSSLQDLAGSNLGR